MAFVHPWQKDPSPSASREHSYSIYRRRRERVPCHWKFSIHQWTQMTSWYQDPEESMNDWKNQRGGSEKEHENFFTSQLQELLSQLQIRAVSSMQFNLLSLLLKQGIAKYKSTFSCCSSAVPYLSLNLFHANGRKASKVGYITSSEKKKQPINFSHLGDPIMMIRYIEYFSWVKKWNRDRRWWQNKV